MLGQAPCPRPIAGQRWTRCFASDVTIRLRPRRGGRRRARWARRRTSSWRKQQECRSTDHHAESPSPSQRTLRTATGTQAGSPGAQIIASQHRAPPFVMAPYTTMSKGQRSSDRTPGAIVWASHGPGFMAGACPSAVWLAGRPRKASPTLRSISGGPTQLLLGLTLLLCARKATRRLTSRTASVFHRSPTSQPNTHRACRLLQRARGRWRACAMLGG